MWWLFYFTSIPVSRIGFILTGILADYLRQNKRSKVLAPGQCQGAAWRQVDLAETAERLRKAVEEHCFRKEEKELSLTVSIGVSLYRLEEDRNGLMMKKRADRALYRAKAAGRNRVMAEGQEIEGES